MSSLLTAVWPEVLAELEQEVGRARFDLWFRSTRIEKADDQRVEIGTPSLFVASWLEEHFKDVVTRALSRSLQREIEVRFVASGELFQQARQAQKAELASLLDEGAARQVAGPSRAAAASAGASPKPKLRRDFTFANFVVGPCNRLACASALEVVNSREPRFNPLFLHSDCGMGKTHLLQAIWHAVAEAADGRQAEYVSAEAFTNEFTYALRQNRLDVFRHKYRRADVLLIDDVHFFNNKNALQEEFLHTFDALDTGHRQLVLASDAHPNDMSPLRKGLVSRFVSGMVVRLDKPGFEVRLEIARQIVARLRKTVDDEVLRYIAQHCQDNVRALQGAIHTALAFAVLSGGKLDIGRAREVFSARSEPRAEPRTMAAIEEAVCADFGVPPADLHTRKRTRAVVLPRQVCMALARKLTSLSCGEIAQHFGTRHHTTVLFSEKSVQARAKADAAFAQRLRTLEEKLADRK